MCKPSRFSAFFYEKYIFYGSPIGLGDALRASFHVQALQACSSIFSKTALRAVIHVKSLPGFFGLSFIRWVHALGKPFRLYFCVLALQAFFVVESLTGLIQARRVWMIFASHEMRGASWRSLANLKGLNVNLPHSYSRYPSLYWLKLGLEAIKNPHDVKGVIYRVIISHLTAHNQNWSCRIYRHFCPRCWHTAFPQSDGTVCAGESRGQGSPQ